jgi:hypothetical protein
MVFKFCAFFTSFAAEKYFFSASPLKTLQESIRPFDEPRTGFAVNKRY